MRGFLLNRLSQSLVLLVIVSIIGFTILSLIPGGPLSQYARDPSMTQQDIERLAAQLGLNRPIWIQYFDWAWRLVQGDWGRSFRDGTSVLAVIGQHVNCCFAKKANTIKYFQNSSGFCFFAISLQRNLNNEKGCQPFKG